MKAKADRKISKKNFPPSIWPEKEEGDDLFANMPRNISLQVIPHVISKNAKST